MNLENVTQDDWIVGGLALLLAIGLLFFPWFDSGSSGPLCSVVSCTSTATGSPDGWLGVLGMIAALAVVADLAVERLSPQTQLPMIGGSRTSTRFILAAIAAGLIALKFLFHIHFSLFGWGFYVTVIVAIALVYRAMQARAAGPIVPSRPAGTAGRGGSAPPPVV